MPLSGKPPSYLKRLSPEHYQGLAWVHWVMTMEGRATGWLNDTMHGAMRELLIHTCARYDLAGPAYCLMPDHGHFLWMGLSDHSDQLPAMKFFRTQLNRTLAPHGVSLQQQPYEHVLNEHERNENEFEDTIAYVFANAERAELVSEWHEWDFLGTIIAGYPDLDPRDSDRFPSRFWKIHHREVERLEKESGS